MERTDPEEVPAVIREQAEAMLLLERAAGCDCEPQVEVRVIFDFQHERGCQKTLGASLASPAPGGGQPAHQKAADGPTAASQPKGEEGAAT